MTDGLFPQLLSKHRTFSVDPVWLFPDQGAYSQVFQSINEHSGKDGGQSDYIVIAKKGGHFVEYEDKWEEQEDDGYYDAIGHVFFLIFLPSATFF